MKSSVKATAVPYKKESTYSNIFSLPVVLWVVGYIAYNFYLEWNSWDTLLEKASQPPALGPNASTLDRWMQVDPTNNAAIAIVRLEQVCNAVEVFDALFIVLCFLIPVFSITRFAMRQKVVLFEAIKCKDGNVQWFIAYVFLGFLRGSEALVAFVLTTMVLPSSFFMCYRVVAQYFCTLVFAIFLGFLILVVLTSAVSRAVLVFDVNYRSLAVIGRKKELDVVQTKRRPSSRREDAAEADSLMSGERFSDERYEDDDGSLDSDDKDYIDNAV